MEQYTSALISAVVVGFLSLLIGVARRGTPTTDQQTGSLVYRHSALLQGFSLFAAFGIPIGITALVIAKPPKDSSDYTAIFDLYALFAALSAPLLWESMRYALVVDTQGLNCRSPWRGRVVVSWDEIHDVSYNALLGWFVIRGWSGRVIRISGLVAGLNTFLDQCEQRLPVAKLRRATPGYNFIGRPFPCDREPDSVSQFHQ